MVAGYKVKVAMPPGGPALSAEQIGLLRAWIDQGANWPDDAVSAAPPPGQRGRDNWAWKPRTKPEPPAVRQTDWVRNPIDRFILAKLEKEGIAALARGRQGAP